MEIARKFRTMEGIFCFFGAKSTQNFCQRYSQNERIFVISDVIFPEEEEESKSSSEQNSTSKPILPKKPETPSRSRLFCGDSLRIDAASKVTKTIARLLIM